MGNRLKNHGQCFLFSWATFFKTKGNAMKNSLPFLFHYAASGLQLLNVLFTVLLIAGGGDQLIAFAVDVDDLDAWIILE